MDLKENIIKLLRWSERFTKTDMAYVAEGSFWWLAGRAGLFVVSFMTMIAFANWLPKESYGKYQFILSALSIFAIFALPGINTALIKSITQKKEGTLRLAVKKKIKWGLIGSFLSLGLAGWYFLQGNNLLAVAFLLVALFLPFRETFHIFASFWNGRKRFDLQAKYQVISACLSAFFIIPAIYLTDNVLIIIAIMFTGHTCFDFLLYKKTEKQKINDEQDSTAISFGKNLTLISALQMAAAYLDKIIIWHFLGAIPVAIYSFAQQPIQKVQELLPIGALALPKLGENKIDAQRKKGIISKFLWLFLFAVPATATLILIAPFLYQLFFPQYMESVVYFQALSLLIVLSPFVLLSAALIAEMKEKALYIINIGAPLLKIILFFVLIPCFGIWGIVTAILITELLRELLGLYFFLRI